MGHTTNLTAADGFVLSAYRADPAGTPRGGLVVAQEIFGVNSHIRSVCDGFAADGYRDRAGAVRPLRARRRHRLHAGRHRQGPRAEGARADRRGLARHRGRARRAGERRQGRRRRLLLGRLHRVDGGGTAVRLRVRGPLLRRRDAGRRRRTAAMSRDGALRRARRDDSRAGVRVRSRASGGAGLHLRGGSRLQLRSAPVIDAPAAKLARERTLQFLRRHVG